MLIGVPKEIKNEERRVGIVPAGVRLLVSHGHKVGIEAGAGAGVGIADEVYAQAGAKIYASADKLWAESEMIMKVKEPVEAEYHRLRAGQILYTYLHLAAVPKLAHVLLENRVSAVAYETIQSADGSLPLLKPMSEVAGRMSVQAGCRCLEAHYGGKGLYLGGVPGVRRGKVTIVGGGVVGINAAKVAVGMGALVTILDVDPKRLAYLDDIFGASISTLMSNPDNLADAVAEADLVIGAVLVAGAKAPILVSEEMVASMEKGSAIVDVAIDQGGSVATIKPTTHSEPVYRLHGVNHYGVTNIPGNVPVTSTFALTNVTLPFAVDLADKGLARAMKDSLALSKGLNIHEGKVCHPAVAQALKMESHSISW